MDSLLGPDGEPLNPAEFFNLVPEETLDEIYDAFNVDAPLSWQIEWDGFKHHLVVFGWVAATSDEGYAYEEFTKISVPIEIPKGYVHVDDLSDERTIQ